MSKRIVFYAVLLILLLAACSREEESATPTALPTATATAVPNPTDTPPPLPTATLPPTPTPEPTPIVPAISVADQPLAENGRLTITNVTIPEPGWLVVHAQRDGQVSEVLGYTAVSPGINADVTVTIDPLQASPTLAAMLHVDAGEAGKYEFPGADEPLQWETAVIAAAFAVDPQFTYPSITITDQDVGPDGLVRVNKVYSPRPGWLLIHADEAGAIGPVLGQSFLNAGLNQDLTIPIRWRQGTPQLYAVLYEDNGRSYRMDEADDLPVLVNGELVMVPFSVTLPPDLFIFDQPVIDGTFVVERVISNGPSWLVVYYDDGGQVGRIIGSALLEDGVNEWVQVEVTQSAVTPELYIRLHEDTNPGDEFGFPAVDRPLAYNGRIPAPFTFRTNPGNYLITRDQSLNLNSDTGTATLTIPLVVVDSEAWVVIRDEVNGQPGDLIGLAWLPAGISRDIMVEVDPEPGSSTLYAILHLDAGTPQEFDFPLGSDIPLQRNRNIIQTPFLLLDEE